MEKLKHVDRPTNLITDEVQRIDARQRVTARIGRGELGPAVQEAEREIRKDHEPIRDSMRDLINHIGKVERNPVAPTKAPISQDPEVLSRHIKRFGYFLKADIMGICRLPGTAVLSHDRNGDPIELDYRNAIVIVVQKDLPTVEASQGSDWIADALSFEAYEYSSLIAETMANYIRRLGYRALTQSTAAGYSIMMPPLLLMAGIGEVCRTGIILNPFLGLGFKAAAVLTDMPLEADKPVDFGLQEFCKSCKKCSQMCPSNAISSGDTVMYNGYETWKLNEERCASFCIMNKRGFWCNMCVKVCPWTRPNTWAHNMVRRIVPRSGLARNISIKADRLFNHDGGIADQQWWFDLVYRDNILQVPSGKTTDNGVADDPN